MIREDIVQSVVLNFCSDGCFITHFGSDQTNCKESASKRFEENHKICIIVPKRYDINSEFLKYCSLTYCHFDFKLVLTTTVQGTEYEVFEFAAKEGILKKVPAKYIGDFICFTAKYLFRSNFSEKHNVLDIGYLKKYCSDFKTLKTYKFLFTNFKQHYDQGFIIDGIGFSTFSDIGSGLFQYISRRVGYTKYKEIDLIFNHVNQKTSPLTVYYTAKDVDLIRIAVLVGNLRAAFIKSSDALSLDSRYSWALDGDFRVVKGGGEGSKFLDPSGTSYEPDRYTYSFN